MFNFRSKKNKFEKLLQKAKNGDAEAQYNLGKMFEYGHEPAVKNLKEAIEWYLKAALQGYVIAQHKLAWKYLNGEGIAKDIAEGINWLQRAAQQDHTQAQLDLAGIYETGRIMPQNMQVAAKWYYEVATKGHAASQFKLGLMFEQGLSIPKDEQAAMAWYEAAIKNGHTQAQERLFRLQKTVKRVRPNYNQEKRSLLLGTETHHRSCSTADINHKEIDPKALMDYKGCLNVSLSIAYSELQDMQKIGSGGSANVYKGIWQGSEVAVKELTIVQIRPETITEFQMESSLMAKLRHPNIVQLYGVCLDPEHCCIVMEFMTKGSLYNMLQDQRQTLPWAIRWQIARDITLGLAFLHSKNIQHRDLKSLNVLLGDKLQAKLTDFGLSKIKTESMATITKSAIGTPRWMAPELIDTGEEDPNQTVATGIYTYKADIYSYGIILWEIASRQIPFSDTPNEFVVMKKITGGIRPIIPNDTPDSYASLINRCWVARPDERPFIEEAVQILNVQPGF